LVKVPQLRPPSNQAKDEYGDDFGDFCIDLHEWLSLLSLESPRISVQDQIDPYLSRYAPPGAESESSKSSELIKITWRGFLSSQWAHKAFAQAVQASSTKHWFAYNLFGFSESMLSPKDCGILRIPGSDTEYLMWEVEEN
jgi:ribonuclease P/MRP protein subunit RPP40